MSPNLSGIGRSTLRAVLVDVDVPVRRARPGPSNSNVNMLSGEDYGIADDDGGGDRRGWEQQSRGRELPLASARGLIPGQTATKGDVAVASFVQRRQRLPLFHRAALYGFFDNERSPLQMGLDRFNHKHRAMVHTGQQKSNLEILLVSVLELWQVAARKEKRLRHAMRQVRITCDSRLLYKALLVWAKQAAITAHRAATWMSAVRGAVRRPLAASLSPFDESSQYKYRYERIVASFGHTSPTHPHPGTPL